MKKEIILIILLTILGIAMLSIDYYVRKSYYKNIIKESLIEMKKKE